MFAIVIGTSLPELFMTITSATKGEFDIAIGNIIGTNIFNICIVLGLPIILYGDVLLTGFNSIDILAVFLSSFFLFLFARSEKTIILYLYLFMIFTAKFFKKSFDKNRHFTLTFQNRYLKILLYCKEYPRATLVC